MTSETNCTWTRYDGTTTQYVTGCTLAGYKISGKGDYADNSIFLLTAGFYDESDGSINDQGNIGACWSSTPKDGDLDYAYRLVIKGQEVYSYKRDHGYSVRAVLMDN